MEGGGDPPSVRIVCLLTLSVFGAQCATLTYSGAISSSDPTFNRPENAIQLSSAWTLYQTFSFVAGSGPWSITGDYRDGGAALGVSNGLEGYLYVYTSFDPLNPLMNLVGADDDDDVDGSGPAAIQDFSRIASDYSYGSGVSGSILTLIPGQNYTLVVTSWADPTSPQYGAISTGAFTITIEGAESVPEPATAWLVGACVTALAARGWRLGRLLA